MLDEDKGRGRGLDEDKGRGRGLDEEKDRGRDLDEDYDEGGEDLDDFDDDEKTSSSPTLAAPRDQAAAPSDLPKILAKPAVGLDGIPKLNLYQLRMGELKEWMTELGLSRKQAEELNYYMYEKGIASFDEVLSFPKQLRRDMSRVASLGAADWETLVEKRSKDGTIKRAYRVPGDHVIESVLMPYGDGRRTACVSTQVGCAQGCVFCATGQMGFKRHLTGVEIFEQAARYSSLLRQQGERLSSVVLLGMGEPLANYNNTLEAVKRIRAKLGIGMRRITISTVGLVPEIRRLADEKLQVTLAISLHAATDEARSKLLPVNRRYNIQEVMDAARYYKDTTGRRVSFEWTLIEGENDRVADAARLGQLIRSGAPGSHVNLIPLNPTKGYTGGATNKGAAARFVEELGKYGVEATVRVRRGIDIDAGCGQLAERAAAEYDKSPLEVPELDE